MFPPSINLPALIEPGCFNDTCSFFLSLEIQIEVTRRYSFKSTRHQGLRCETRSSSEGSVPDEHAEGSQGRDQGRGGKGVGCKVGCFSSSHCKWFRQIKWSHEELHSDGFARSKRPIKHLEARWCCNYETQTPSQIR